MARAGLRRLAMHAGQYPYAAVAGERSVYSKGCRRNYEPQSETRKPKRKQSYGQYIRERWRSRLDNERKGRRSRAAYAVGQWDIYIAVAERYHWTPEEFGRLDPDFLEELSAYWSAQADLDSKK